MPLRRFFGLARALLVVVGVLLFASAMHTATTATSPPPGSDGFVEGLALVFSIVFGVAGLLLVQVGYAFPAGTGRLRIGPLADRSAGLRAGIAVLLILTAALVLTFGGPAVAPGLAEGTAYAAALIATLAATVLGAVLAAVVALGGFLLRELGAD